MAIFNSYVCLPECNLIITCSTPPYPPRPGTDVWDAALVSLMMGLRFGGSLAVWQGETKKELIRNFPAGSITT